MRYQVSLFLYRLVILLLTPVLILALLIRSRTQAAYRQRITERFGFLNKKLKKNGIVIHAASVGEVLALKGFIEQLLAKQLLTQEPLPITLTTFTPTGSEQVSKLFGGHVQHCYLPIDNPVSSHLFLKRLQPKTLVFMETELWPNLIAQAHAQEIKLLLINGRLSAKSTPSYQKIAWLIGPSLNRFEHILCQSQVSLDNFIQLGAEPNRCQLTGNIKYDINLSESTEQKIAELSSLIKDKRRVWIVASTHLGDEDIALLAFKKLKKSFNDLLLILVPRHPERFADVNQLCQQEFSTVTRSSEQAVYAKDDIWLIDTLGELLAAYALADVVTMGGSFSNIGGHNPLEPALFKKPLVVGADMSNFSEIMQQLLAKQAIIQLPANNNKAGKLAHAVADVFTNQTLAQQLGDNAQQVVFENQGATETSVRTCLELLNK